MKTYLKVKLLSLWEEAKIIQNQENKFRELSKERPEYFEVFRGLYGHRKGIVAQEQRATFIAYAFLRGRAFHKVEARPMEVPVKALAKAARMVAKHGVVYSDKPGFKNDKQAQLVADFATWVQNGINFQKEGGTHKPKDIYNIHDVERFLSLISDTPSAIYSKTYR